MARARTRTVSGLNVGESEWLRGHYHVEEQCGPELPIVVPPHVRELARSGDEGVHGVVADWLEEQQGGWWSTLVRAGSNVLLGVIGGLVPIGMATRELFVGHRQRLRLADTRHGVPEDATFLWQRGTPMSIEVPGECGAADHHAVMLAHGKVALLLRKYPLRLMGLLDRGDLADKRVRHAFTGNISRVDRLRAITHA